MKPAINMKALKANLRDALVRYRNERPNLSLRAITKNSGCNRYFLNKLIEENDNNISLDLNQVLILSQFMTGRASVKEAIESSGQEVQDTISKIFNIDYLNIKRISSKMSRVNLYDSYIYFVLVLASYARGTRREYITKILGYKGEQTLRKLLREQIVIEVNKRIRLKEGNEFTLSPEVMKLRIPDYLKYYSYDRLLRQEQKNFLYVYSEGLNEKAVKRVHNLHARLNNEIQKIIMDENNHGEIPFFTFGCMDRFYDETETCEDGVEDDLESEEEAEEVSAPAT